MGAITVHVNGTTHSLDVDSRMSLLDVLRERLGLTGSKKGCDHGQCGACTVLIDGRRAVSCLALAVAQDGTNVTTVEGLAAMRAGRDAGTGRRAAGRGGGAGAGRCTRCRPHSSSGTRSSAGTALPAAGSATCPSPPRRSWTDAAERLPRTRARGRLGR